MTTRTISMTTRSMLYMAKRIKGPKGGVRDASPRGSEAGDKSR